ncbi:MAG: hypothetical protein CL878_09975 [Dehalococcoidia bacterium]|nr:hypothetical protein [Dehalococcoidia bacterium]
MNDDALHEDILSRFPDEALLEVTLSRYGDQPDIEPHELKITLVPRGPSEHNDDPDEAPEEVRLQVIEEFTKLHRGSIQQLQKDLARLVPEQVQTLSLAYGSAANYLRVLAPSAAEQALTPVMTRLNSADLETLDTLIAAGIAPSRAEAVRWCLSIVRERPAYGELQKRIRDIQELKTQF